MGPLSSPPFVGQCPARETLAGFDQGELTFAELQAVAAHLASCPACLGLLQGLGPPRDDSALGRLRRCWERPGPPDEPAYARMEAGALALGPSADAAPTAILRAGLGPAAGPPVGKRIGPYLVLAGIGQGGMGVVYRARQLPVDRLVALKMLRGGAFAGGPALARFLTEGKAVARLQHPNVVQIHEFGEHEGLPYFSMELVEGGSLAARLALGPLEPRAAAELVRTLAGAVEYAHRKQVVHRDLKPGNVLLTPDGVPKVADFGLAKLLDAEGGEQTQPDAILGTPNYMAPEQAAGRPAEVGPASDVYALGAILYHTLTGSPPFQGDTRARTLELVRGAEPAPPSRGRAGIPPRLEAICLKCLAKPPGRRYPSAQALADDLGRYLRGEPTDARPLGWAAQLGRGLSRRPWAAAAGLLLIVGLSALFLLDPERPRRGLEQALDRGEPAALLGAAGPPVSYRIRQGDDSTKVSVSRDGTFTVHTWSLCLLEFLPDPRCERYRFRVSIRHDQSDLGGEVGVFCAHRAFPAAGRESRVFYQMTYNDIRTAGDVAARGPPAIARKLVVPRENRVSLGVNLYAEEAPGRCAYAPMAWTSGAPFRAGGMGNGEWRELELLVGPGGVQGFRDGRPVGELPAADAAAALTRRLNEALLRRPADPLLTSLEPAFAPRGGFGLFLYRGSASFRDATLTPLKNP
jgi:serine/threonine-protein kinase